MLLKKTVKQNEPKLDPKLAGQMLQNVFDVCDAEPNAVPLEDLVSYANYRKERFSLQKTLLIVALLLFCLVPFLFIAPSISVDEQANGTYHVKVSSVLPVNYISAAIGDSNMPVYDKGRKMYSVEPDANGIMTIEVGLINRQKNTKIVDVGNVDRKPPTVLSHSTQDHYLLLTLADDSSGVDYENIYATDKTGKTIFPASYNEKNGIVIFLYPQTDLNVTIPDKSNNTLHLLLTL